MKSNEVVDVQKRQKALMDLVFGLVCMFLGSVIFYSSTKIPTSVFERVGAGFFPKIVSACMVALGLWLAVSAGRHVDRKTLSQISVDIRGNLPVMAVLGLYVIFSMTLEIVGFRVGAFAFLMLSVWILGGFGRKELVQGAVVGVTLTLVVYYGFKEALRLMLP